MFVKQQGLSLIEILVTIAIGVFLLGGASSLGLFTINNTYAINHKATLQQEMDNILNLISNDIARAGFSTNNFQRIWLNDQIGTSGNFKCIIYRYDRNSNSAVDADETRGIYFNVDTTNAKNNEIRILRNSDLASTNNCSDAIWSDNDKAPVIHNKQSITINSLNLKPHITNLTNSNIPANTVDSVEISLTATQTGRLSSTSDDQQLTITRTVQLRNLPIKQ
ncbi:PilW family protein [Chitinibacter sp. GC72]|uniref:PilW family protein n=1 Tax=Chitinibacter sp. GC72 TaxID=1526917 RepID=UPI0012FA0C9E|nr:prepilin-type N-terminal cleavage/methylation domain-containing protein [Chitinibacter sp. GC72]